jgi:DtxR family Mn-dependent transcriptional regulator
MVDLSYTQEDYIKTIWRLEENFQIPKMKVIAEEIGVKPPTVSAMIRQLENMNLIEYSKKTGACLTQSGKRQAERIIRNHRLIETFLQQVLELEEPLLHAEAEKLEHAISETVIKKIDAYLGYPRLDPHGSRIPGPGDGTAICRLDQVYARGEFRIESLPESQQEKEFCHQNEFISGSIWEIIQIEPNGESYLVSNGTHYLAVSASLARSIWVELLEV